jgi:hypothetical protein
MRIYEIVLIFRAKQMPENAFRIMFKASVKYGITVKSFEFEHLLRYLPFHFN